MRTLVRLRLLPLCASWMFAVFAADVGTSAPGWTFRESDAPAFRLFKIDLSSRDWTLLDWRGNDLRQGRWAADGTLELAPLPPGYYHVAYPAFGATNEFSFCVVGDKPCHNPDSFFAVDSAFTQCSRPGEFDCPWYGGDTYRVTAELMGLCGVSHTRERIAWMNMNTSENEYDFSRYLPNAQLMKRNGVVSLGLFADTPPWAGREPGRYLPRNLLGLYRFMEKAVTAFGDCYDAWEYWNEQDLSRAAGPVWEYAATLKAFSLGMAAGDPSKAVLPGSVSAIDHQGFCQGMFDNDIAKYVDAFNLHTYFDPSSFQKWHGDIRKFLAEAGVPDFQVWLTEYGTNLEGHGKRDSVRKGMRAHSPEQELLMSEICAKGCILNQFGGIYRCWWFLFGCYNERHGEKDWGTMRRDGSVKPVHAVIATLNRELGDAKLRGEITGGNGTRKFLYENPDGSQTVVFWRETFVDAAKAAARPAPDELPVEIAVRDGSYRMVDVMGTPSKVPAAGGALRLSATRYPQYATGLSGLKADVPAAPSGKFGRKPARADEDLTVVVRPHVAKKDFDIGGRHCVAELLGDAGNIEIEVWNFSPEAKKGCLVVEGGSLRNLPDVISLPPFGKVDLKVEYLPPEGDAVDFVIRLRGRFNGRISSCATIPVMCRKRFLSKCEVVPWPALNSPSAWTRNDSADTYRCVYDEAEQAVRFDVEWKPNSSRGAWFFPVHTLKLPEESLAGAKMIEFEVKTAQDKVENDFGEVVVMALYKDKPVRYLPYLRPMREWGVRRAAVSSDSGEYIGLRFGVTPAGRRLTYWIRNVRILK